MNVQKSELRYAPWLGDSFLQWRTERESGAPFTSGFDDPVHILGESHYGTVEDDAPNLTARVVRECGFEAGPHSRFFAGALQAVRGKSIAEIDRPAAWQSLAFSNYIQTLLDSSRKEPTPPMWEQAAGLWRSQLQAVRAPIIMVCGWRLWRNLTGNGGIEVGPLRDLNDQIVVEQAWAYESVGDDFRAVSLAIPVTHPSGRGFDWREAHRRLRVGWLNYDNVLSHFEATWIGSADGQG